MVTDFSVFYSLMKQRIHWLLLSKPVKVSRPCGVDSTLTCIFFFFIWISFMSFPLNDQIDFWQNDMEDRKPCYTSYVFLIGV